MNIQHIDVQTAKTWLDSNEATLIDVREFSEYASQRITGAKLNPLSSICLQNIENSSNKKILIYCQKGMRGYNACKKLLTENSLIEIYNIDGGIEAWKQAGLTTEGNGKKILSIDRQVQLVIGLSILLFGSFSYFVNPTFILGTIFIGLGLINASLTGWCGLAKVINKLPWNQ